MLEKHHFPDSLDSIDALDLRALELSTVNHLCPSLFIPDNRIWEVTIYVIGSGQTAQVELENFYLDEIYRLNNERYLVIRGWRPSLEPFKRLVRLGDELISFTTPTCHYFGTRESARQWVSYLRLSNQLPTNTIIDM
jgi:hypothetical protein